MRSFILFTSSAAFLIRKKCMRNDSKNRNFAAFKFSAFPPPIDDDWGGDCVCTFIINSFFCFHYKLHEKREASECARLFIALIGLCTKNVIAVKFQVRQNYSRVDYILLAKNFFAYLEPNSCPPKRWHRLIYRPALAFLLLFGSYTLVLFLWAFLIRFVFFGSPLPSSMNS